MPPKTDSRQRPTPALPAYGSDRAEPGPDGSRLLLCGVSKGWLPRKPRTQTAAEHPGTAVAWEQEVFEVVEASPSSGGGVQYRLQPWDPRHAIRDIQRYDAPAEQQRAAEQDRRRDAVRLRRLSILFAPLLGHLPGPVQQKMEGDFGAPAAAMTIVSALPLFALGGVGLLAKAAPADFFPWWLTPPLPLALYWFVESFLRLTAAFLAGTPMGSLPGVLAYELWRGLLRPGEPAPVTEPSPARPSRWKPGDTYRMLEPLLSLLSPDEQETLERRFGFESLKWGRRGAIAIVIVAVLNIVISLGMLAQARDTVWDALWLVAGGYLCLEQIARLRRIRGGHPAGSVLGALIRPLARSLLVPPAAN